MTPVQIDLLTLTTCSAYACVLARFNHRIAPDHTWKSVAVGVGICLGFARLHTTSQPGATWNDHERNMLRSLAVGCIPIVLWQELRRDADHARAWAILKGLATHGEASER
ncbi:MAG TPA: hypothetical protein VFZ66_29765 [Herpetosiphonaceae bacterium]